MLPLPTDMYPISSLKFAFQVGHFGDEAPSRYRPGSDQAMQYHDD